MMNEHSCPRGQKGYFTTMTDFSPALIAFTALREKIYQVLIEP